MEMGGWCGIKYQVTNSNVDAALKFKLLSDNAVTFAVSAATAFVLALTVF